MDELMHLSVVMQKLMNPSHVQRTYGYVGLSKKVNGYLNPKVGFNTFAEIAEDLLVFDKSQWQVTFVEHDFKSKFPHVYKVVGNGFLEEM